MILTLVLPERNFYYYQAKPVDICGKEYDLPKYISNNDVSYAHNLKLRFLSASEESISVESSEYDNFLSNSHLELWKEVNGERSFLKDVYSLTNYDVSISSNVERFAYILFLRKICLIH